MLPLIALCVLLGHTLSLSPELADLARLARLASHPASPAFYMRVEGQAES